VIGEIKRAGNRVVISWGEKLDEETTSELDRKILAALGEAGQRRAEALFDLRAVRTFDLNCRHLLIAAQKILAQRARRTAYLADRPHVRGLATWLIHHSADGNACVAMSQAQADAWLSSSGERIPSAQQRVTAAIDSLEQHIKRGGGR
jgi:anti-anti-sigma regulatory factor